MTQHRILVPGSIHPHVEERLNAAFDVVRIAKADPALVTDDLARSVQGIAVSGSLTTDFVEAFASLEIIANFGVGYDGIDARHAGEKNIVVTNTPDVLDEEVADTTIGLLLNTVRQYPQAQAYLRAGRWEKEGAFPLTPLSLRGRTVGMYGLGRIGQAIARRLEGFGVSIAYHTRKPREDVTYTYYDSLEALAEAVDTLIAIVPKTNGTHKTINADILRKLGSNGVLINVGRGWTVDEDALVDALKTGVIAAAGLDVFYDEPHVPQALIDLPNATLLPHVASASQDTRRAMANLVVDNLINWFEKGEALTPVPETSIQRSQIPTA